MVPLRRRLTLHERLSYSHECLGEEIMLRMVDAHVGQVLFCDRCDLDPVAGCDGIPLFEPGEWVELPGEWPTAWWRPIGPSDLSATTGPPLTRLPYKPRWGAKPRNSRKAV